MFYCLSFEGATRKWHGSGRGNVFPFLLSFEIRWSCATGTDAVPSPRWTCVVLRFSFVVKCITQSLVCVISRVLIVFINLLLRWWTFPRRGGPSARPRSAPSTQGHPVQGWQGVQLRPGMVWCVFAQVAAIDLLRVIFFLHLSASSRLVPLGGKE